MLPDPLREGGTADLFLSFKDEFHIVAKLAGPHQIFKGLDVHEQLSLVIIRPPCIDGVPSARVLPDDRLERIRIPLFQGLRRLDIVVAVDQDGLQGGIDGLARENYGITIARADLYMVGTGFGEEGGKSFRTPLHVGFMLRLRAHGRNPEQGEQFAKEPVPVVHDVLFHLYGD